MTIVKRNPVPIYEITCEECGSVIQYKAAEVHHCILNCPVCGTMNWAHTITPVGTEEVEEPTND